MMIKNLVDSYDFSSVIHAHEDIHHVIFKLNKHKKILRKCILSLILAKMTLPHLLMKLTFYLCSFAHIFGDTRDGDDSTFAAFTLQEPGREGGQRNHANLGKSCQHDKHGVEG